VVYDTIATMVDLDGSLSLPNGRVVFVDGPGGTGKIFLFDALLNKARCEDKIAVAVAALSGTASLLLEGGRTSQSVFKVPLNVDPDDMFNIKPNSPTANLLMQTELISWDEFSMTSKEIFEALDRSLKDTAKFVDPRLENVPFGGDFRQISPVFLKGSRSQLLINVLIVRTIGAMFKFSDFVLTCVSSKFWCRIIQL
jgi:hypothetical protein